MIRNTAIGIAVPNRGALDFTRAGEAPAGKHGFVTVKDGHFYFEDGKRARFFGFNIPARGSLPDHETAEKVSARLATLGVNCVRMCAVDVTCGTWGFSVDAKHPLIDYPAFERPRPGAGLPKIHGTSRELNPAGLERLDHWVYCLKQKGIYVHVDLLVSRAFLPDDGLDYDEPLFMVKCSSHFNRRLIELQKEYARKLLTHVNPYTGLALKDDPCVMCVQIANEDSVFFDAAEGRGGPGVAHYREELKGLFNTFLLKKYGSRDEMARAWTGNGNRGPGEDEDPAKGTVECAAIGDYQQPQVPGGEAGRYADWFEFGIGVNRAYYDEMIAFVKGLGVRVPVVTSCLLGGAADVYSHSAGDFMENNTYFNHPAPRRGRNGMYIPNMREYISTDPLTQTRPGMEPRGNLTVQASLAVLRGKPFVLSEWNEYGEEPFHSSCPLMTTAYACLNDWDGLIPYAYHISDTLDRQPEDEIRDIMSVYNDPSMMLQVGVMSRMFLDGLVAPSKASVDVVYTAADVLAQPAHHRLPYTYLPFVLRTRNVYTAGGTYDGGADAAVTAGFTCPGDLPGNAVRWTHMPFSDAYMRNECTPPEGGEGDLGLLAPESYDYTAIAARIDRLLKKWNVIPPCAGLAEDGFVSSTGELAFAPGRSVFTLNTDRLVSFSGYTKNGGIPSGRFGFIPKNDKLTASFLSLDGEKLSDSHRVLFTAVGRSGMDGTEYERDGEDTIVRLAGKLYFETPEGELVIRGADSARVYALDMYGERIRELTARGCEDGIRLLLDGENGSGCFEIIV